MAGSPKVVQQALQISDSRIQQMREAYQQGGADAAAQFVTPDDVDKLAIVGTPDKIADHLRRLEQQGIDQLVIFLQSTDLDENRKTLQDFIRDILPKV
jgi:alkanesulfonate monooxygenase SsuD/methylene tetrahydromethanopterin reductase-like flavin-dependent oxidoreductase (luciferase family)